MKRIFDICLSLAVLACAFSCSKDSDFSTPVNLSENGTANCYIVPKAGAYTFNATVKGNGDSKIAPAKAEVLWESYGTKKAPRAGAIIKSVSLSDGTVKFTTPKVLADGNALIAVRDESGDILWSWHIWVCKDFYPKNTAQTYNNTDVEMMDRDLGSTSVAPGNARTIGLMYQWGRKDPFLATTPGDWDRNLAGSSAKWPTPLELSATEGDIEYATKHPMTFMKHYISSDWLAVSDATLWKSEKTIYDPCPVGWRVPDGGKDGVWAKALGFFGAKPFDISWPTVKEFGFNFGLDTEFKLGPAPIIWYPATGYSSGIPCEIGESIQLWSCTAGEHDSAYAFFVSPSYEINTSCEFTRQLAHSVRCCKEK